MITTVLSSWGRGLLLYKYKFFETTARLLLNSQPNGKEESLTYIFLFFIFSFNKKKMQRFVVFVHVECFIMVMMILKIKIIKLPFLDMDVKQGSKNHLDLYNGKVHQSPDFCIQIPVMHQHWF